MNWDYLSTGGGKIVNYSTYKNEPYPEPKTEKVKTPEPEDEEKLKEKRVGWWKKAKEAWKNWK